MVRAVTGSAGSKPVEVAIAGGFVLIDAKALLGAWRACRARPLGMGDFRTWLALREMGARRCRLGDGRAPSYGYAEVARLMGVTERRARASIRRLVVAGLVEWSDAGIVFPESPGTDLGPLADSIGGGRGPVAIPRRMLRLLAGGARPALIATSLGVLLRCVSRRRSGWDGRGRLKASWIADAFGVDLRRVKAARLELVNLGWITPEASGQRAENRWGRAYRVDLGWDRARSNGPRLPPPPASDRPAIATPSVDPEPLPERGRNQEPAGRGPAGVRLDRRGPGAMPIPAAALLPAPNLDDVRPEDLHDVGRAMELHCRAVDRGLADPSEAGRLQFLAAVEHSRAIGTTNSAGLLARIVRRGWWHFATQDDEDTARRRLRQHLHPRVTPTAPPARSGTFVPADRSTIPSTLGGVMGGFLASRGIVLP